MLDSIGILSRLNWNFEMLVFGEGKTREPGEKRWSKDKNQQQT